MEAVGKRSGRPASFEQIRKMFTEADANGDGVLSYDEWMAAQLFIKRRHARAEAAKASGASALRRAGAARKPAASGERGTPGSLEEGSKRRDVTARRLAKHDEANPMAPGLPDPPRNHRRSSSDGVAISITGREAAQASPPPPGRAASSNAVRPASLVAVASASSPLLAPRPDGEGAADGGATDGPGMQSDVQPDASDLQSDVTPEASLPDIGSYSRARARGLPPALSPVAPPGAFPPSDARASAVSVESVGRRPSLNSVESLRKLLAGLEL